MKNLLFVVALCMSFATTAQISISIQPSTSTQTLCVGATASALSVSATGMGVLTYQWYSNTANSNTGGTIINTATNSSYTPSTTTAGTLYYYVVVTIVNSASITSNVSGAVTVNALPSSSFTVTPSVLCSGFPVQFNAPSACASNGAVNFSGISSSAMRTTITSVVDNVTMEIWVKWTGQFNANENQLIFYNGNTGNCGYGILMNPNGGLYVFSGGVAFQSANQSLKPNVWTHIAIVRNSGIWSMYINGTAYTVDNSGAIPRSPTRFSGNKTVIGANNFGGESFQGLIDEAKFWTVARSASNIQADMNACNVSAQSGLLAYWNFNETSGSSASDGSGNAYTLSLTGNSWSLTGAPTGASYSWSFASGVTSILGADAYTYTSSGTKNLSLTVTDATTGCASTTSSSLTVNLSPTASIIGTSTACNEVSLTASGGTIYAWDGGNASNAATNTFSSSNTYNVTVTDAIGCTATASAVVTVNPLLTAPTSGPMAAMSTFATGFDGAYAVTTDALGNVYTANQWDGSISKIDSNGSVSTFVNSNTFNNPNALAFYSGILYVAEQWNNRISKVASDGSVTSFVSSGLYYPTSMVFDGLGNLFVANDNGSISKVASNGAVSSFVSDGSFNSPSAIAFYLDTLYVAEQWDNKISKVTAAGSITSFVTGGLNNPSGLAFDGSGNLFVVNINGGVINKILPNGTISTYVGSDNNNLTGLTIAANKNLYTTDQNNSVFKVIPPADYVSSVCDAGVVTLIASPKTGETIDWYAAASGGTALQTGSNNFTTPSISTTTTYYAEARNSTTGCVSATRLAVIATVNSCSNVWMGGTSTDFNNPNNWSAATVPSSGINVTVGNGINSLVIPDTQSVGSLTINSGASLTVTGTLKIGGSISNSGTLTATSGTIELNGSSAQSIPANVFTSNTVQNLSINNSAGVSFEGTLTVTGVLTPTAGTLNTGGNLTLASSATGTASVAAGTGTYISGNVTTQRYTRAQRGYRTLGHPFTTAQNLGILTDNFRITGLTTNAGSGTYATSAGNPSAFLYDPTQTIGSTSVLTRLTDATANVWGVGKGLYVFVRGAGNEGMGGAGASNYSTLNPVTIDGTGAINQGDITVNLIYGGVGKDNYNLIGNPYPCPINLKTVTGINSYGTVYVYNPVKNIAGSDQYNVSGGFDQYTNDGSTDIIVPVFGAFYIQATGNGQSLTFKESDKAVGSTPSYTVFGTDKNPKVSLQIANANGVIDELKLGVNSGSSDASTDKYDAAKLGNSLFNFYSLSSDRKALAIDYRANLNSTIPLGLQTNLANKYTISLSALTDLSNTQLVLRDKFLKTETILSQVGDSYNFSITADTATKGDNRFEIGLLGTTVLPTQIADITAQLQANKTVAVSWTSTTEVNLASYNVQRSKDGSNFTTVGTVAAKGASAYNYNDDLSTAGVLPSTIYYRLEALDKDGSKTYSKVVSCQLSVANKSISIYPNPVQATLYAQVTVTKAGAAQLRVIDAQGKVVATQKTQLAVGTTSVSIPAAQLTAGNYALEIDSADGKQTQRFVKE